MQREVRSICMLGKFFREKERNARSDLYIIRILSARRRMMGGGSEFVGIFHASINV